MSHTLASRCAVCGVVDDRPCPECRTSSAQAHGIAEQRPFTSDLVYADGTRHEWHPGCLTTPTPPGQVPCVCGEQMTEPYPNDTGEHSTTECPIPPGSTAPESEETPA